MRVISGKFKGTPLQSPKGDKVRPTGDKVKEAVFAKLSFDLPDSRVLDLFCGSGALGIEALSRGAKEVVFVDKHRDSVLITKQNLEKVKVKTPVYLRDAILALKSVTEPFDIIFIDPPYMSKLYTPVLQVIKDKNLLKPDGVIICEHPKELQIDMCGFDVFDKKNYGTVMVSYLRN